jgi:PTH1 family peptidyl-tRNA hydrolase
MPERHLLIGLGNPGREYRFNRHNIGFMLLDRLVARHGWPGFTRRQGKALITTGSLNGAPLVLAKPQTYMNLSGEAVGSLVRFFALPLERLLVCVDEIDLPLGTLRLRPGGGSAGHGGMKSIIQHLGTETFPRLRLGVGRPPGVRAAAHYVLRDFQRDEHEIVEELLDRAADAVECYTQAGLDMAMNRYNGPSDTP